MKKSLRLSVMIPALLWAFLAVFSVAAALAAPAAESVTVSGPREVAAGASVRLTATVSPESAKQDIVWKSSDESIAKVSASGRVKGISAGKVKIIAAAASNPEIKKSFTVTVLKKAVRKIRITAETKKLDLNGRKTVTLQAKASPSAASQAVRWKSSDPKVVKISEKGVATAIYDSNTVGGEQDPENKAIRGLKEVESNLKNYFFLETMQNNKSGLLTLKVSLEGETQGNNYQDSQADIAVRFAVEVTPGSYIIKTGDEPMQLLPWYIGMAAAGILFVVLAVTGLRQRKRKEEESK